VRCPLCDTENKLGTTYCKACGEKLELTDVRAQVEAAAEVQHDTWQRAARALGRTLFVVGLVFVVALLFRGCARQEIMANFGAAAPLPSDPSFPLGVPPVVDPRVPPPPVPRGPAMPADGVSEAAILDALALTARDRLHCVVVLKTGGAIRGTLLARTRDEIQVITGWDPPQVRAVGMDNVDLVQSQLPD